MKNKRKKCQLEHCSKTLPLIALNCRCGLKFCNRHWPDHSCTFDELSNHQEKLMRENGRLSAQKVTKI
jgi:hypothetical protein|tara:strand:+ start:2417 stop:2620 length:204 start_codon:yes stop_codon:yes gene_type:complete